VFDHSDLAAIARGFGVDGKKVTDLADIPELVAAFADNGTVAVWDFHVSNQVLSPIIRRTHPPRSTQA
jgi:thiamine pyrophosphate-dependent acetolactate synthase large subunit-like protein